MTPGQTRSAIAVFVLVGTVIAVNVLFLQGTGDRQMARREGGPQLAGGTEAERQRRLALAPHEGRLQRSGVEPRAAAATTGGIFNGAPASPNERIGRFAPDAARVAVMRVPDIDPRARNLEIVRAVQRGLAERGYEPGVADGVPGLATRAAVMAYEHDHGLPSTAEPSESLLLHMQKGAGTPPATVAKPATAPAKPPPVPQAEQVVRSLQHSLAMLGYFAGRIDGQVGEDTVRAIREYEVDSGLVPTGRVSAPLLARMARTMNASSMRPPG